MIKNVEAYLIIYNTQLVFVPGDLRCFKTISEHFENQVCCWLLCKRIELCWKFCQKIFTARNMTDLPMRLLNRNNLQITSGHTRPELIEYVPAWQSLHAPAVTPPENKSNQCKIYWYDISDSVQAIYLEGTFKRNTSRNPGPIKPNPRTAQQRSSSLTQQCKQICQWVQSCHGIDSSWTHAGLAHLFQSSKSLPGTECSPQR
jgi:hypothetical protein